MLASPITRTWLSPNRYSNRGGKSVGLIVIHTQEGGRTAWDLAAFLANPNSQVSYNAVVDDRESVLSVPWNMAPWAASNANNIGDHICAAGSYAAWTRGKWLETDASDGKNEDQELTNLARLVAWRCQERDIPPVYVGGNGNPLSRKGICGHMDFGAWGGGHHDPGPSFPWDELIRRTQSFLEAEDWTPVYTELMGL